MVLGGGNGSVPPAVRLPVAMPVCCTEYLVT